MRRKVPRIPPLDRRLRDEDAALAELPRLLLVGFRERQRPRRPAPAVQKLAIARHLQLYAGRAIIAELEGERPAGLLNSPERFAGPRGGRRDLAVRRVEGLIAHRRFVRSVNVLWLVIF
jgi:hypothetical protein